jgi:uncharacterized membrane protein YfcA
LLNDVLPLGIALLSFVAGATASIVGFGIGSLLTPLMAARFGTDLAIAAIALPHLSGGLLRGWRLRHCVDRRVLVRFGVLSAIGGLIGALVFAQLAPSALGGVLGALLVLTAVAGLTGWSERWTPRGPLAWVLGALSGFFGGVVGNQGGLRAAALSAFGLKPTVFVATSTVIGVMIDLVRTPVYLFRAGAELLRIWPLVALAVVGVLAGTLVGERLLLGLSRERFRQVVSIAIGLLGLWFLLRAGG